MYSIDVQQVRTAVMYSNYVHQLCTVDITECQYSCSTEEINVSTSGPYVPCCEVADFVIRWYHVLDRATSVEVVPPTPPVLPSWRRWSDYNWVPALDANLAVTRRQYAQVLFSLLSLNEMSSRL